MIPPSPGVFMGLHGLECSSPTFCLDPFYPSCLNPNAASLERPFLTTSPQVTSSKFPFKIMFGGLLKLCSGHHHPAMLRNWAPTGLVTLLGPSWSRSPQDTPSDIWGWVGLVMLGFEACTYKYHMFSVTEQSFNQCITLFISLIAITPRENDISLHLLDK